MEKLKDMATITPEHLVEIAETKGKEFNGIKTNQIRNFYSSIIEMKQIMQNDKDNTELVRIHSQLILLQPKLAYAAGRQTVVKPLYEFIIKAIAGVSIHKNKPEQYWIALGNFFDLIEAVVAYHKFHGGRDN